MRTRLHEWLDAVLEAPGIGDLRKRRFDADFRRGHHGNSCRGVYATYAQAAAAAPNTLPLGYDHESAASMYRDRLDRVYPSDYAVLHWMEEAFKDGATRIFDLGGHVGVGYYAYQNYLKYPPGLQWQLFDMPAVLESAKELARERDHLRALVTTGRVEDAAGADVLFSSGCLQYREDSLPELLGRLSPLPRRIILNLIPLHPELEFWTVQSIGTAFCPYRIQRRSTFFQGLERVGYEVLDVWENAEKRCFVAFEPGHSFTGYTGAALKLR
ncbi:MAG: methyltransferase, TIGR04325 family [Steroidobacteraceae bacterium]